MFDKDIHHRIMLMSLRERVAAGNSVGNGAYVMRKGQALSKVLVVSSQMMAMCRRVDPGQESIVMRY